MKRKQSKHVPVSDQLRQILDRCGVSRYRISRETGITDSALSRFMSGERGLSSKALDALGKYLELEVVSRKEAQTDGK